MEGVGPPDAVILDGSRQGPVVSFASGEGRTSILRNLTVQHGAPVANPYGYGGPSAGGIFIQNAAPTISGVVISSNLECGIGSFNSSPLIQGSVIEETSHDSSLNGCPAFGVIKNAQGSGIFLVGRSASGMQSEITGNIVTANSSTSYSTAGVQATDAGSLLINNNIVFANVSESLGAGIGVGGDTSANVLQNLVYANIVNNPPSIVPAGADAGGINIDVNPGFTVLVTNNTVALNHETG